MKFALYTIFRCTNYGAVLQAYALSRTLRAVAGDNAVEVINHRMDARDTHLLGKVTNPNTPWFQRWRNRRKFAARYYHPELFEVRRRKTVRLIEDFIRPTERMYKTPSQLREMPSYATVVVGSDQVWNPLLNHDFGHNQYLCEDFPESQDRVAYAASFGVSELPPECQDGYRTALSRFRTITVREETGARLCETLLSSPPPPVVLDPTLLMSADEWRIDAVRGHDTPKAPAGRYLAAYWVRTLVQADVDRLACVARVRNASVCLLSAGPLPRLSFPPSVSPYVNADPFDFVRTVAGAVGLVTDSFHGLQFAALFGKPFLALGDLKASGSNSSRLVDFCARYGVAGGVRDLTAFRNGDVASDLAETGFDEDLMARDRDRSLRELKGMLTSAQTMGEGENR